MIRFYTTLLKVDLKPEVINSTTVGQNNIYSVYLHTKTLRTSIKSTMLKVSIDIEEKALFNKSSYVERMGRRGWRGRILEISSDSALVNWGGGKTWVPMYELYPLDEQGKPHIYNNIRKKKFNLLETARHARSKLGDNYPERNNSDIQQMNLF
jgi:hypothetical protein